MKIKRLFFGIIFLMLAFVLFLVTVTFLGFVQEKLFLPKDYIMWVFKYPVSRYALVFELYFLLAFFRKSFVGLEIIHFAKKHKQWFYPIFVFVNLLLIYVLLFNVCVITNDKIINRSFHSPQGRVYNYSDIVSIDTGVYGKNNYIPFIHSFINQSGQFYYIITLKDGTKIDLNGDAGGNRNDQDMNEVFQDIDKSLVNMGIKKTAKTDNFQSLEKSMDKIYSDKIKSILNNVNRERLLGHGIE